LGGGLHYADDAEVERIGKEAGTRGGYTRDELLRVARWKTRGRSEWRCKLNTAEDVRRATARALATDDERERVAVLIGLHGVQLPTASALLHLARPSLFPIIDFRALWSLGIDEAPTFYGFPLWWAYVTTCRSLAANAGVSMRRLDRALWQYSKQYQRRVPVRDRAPIHMRTAARANVSPRASERIESTRSPGDHRRAHRADRDLEPAGPTFAAIAFRSSLAAARCGRQLAADPRPERRRLRRSLVEHRVARRGSGVVVC